MSSADRPLHSAHPFDPASLPSLVGLIQRRTRDELAAGELLRRLGALVEVTLTANERMNLTGDREPRLFWERHIEDALWAAERIEAAFGTGEGNSLPSGTRVLDVGSGGGIPGLVWATLWPEARVDLLESRARRVQFLNEAIGELGLAHARAFEGRAESWGHLPERRESYDLVTARALAPLPTLLELTLPFARVGGCVAAIKSAQIEAELEQAGEALHQLGAGGRVPEQIGYIRGDGKACLVCLVRKERPTPDAYPRPANLPERRPLLPGAGPKL